jgi:hypothetical protein
VPGFSVEGFWTGFFVAIFISVFGFFTNLFIGIGGVKVKKLPYTKETKYHYIANTESWSGI